MKGKEKLFHFNFKKIDFKKQRSETKIALSFNN